MLITASWETSDDGERWRKDFDLTCTRISTTADSATDEERTDTMSKVIFSRPERHCGCGVGGRHLRHGGCRLASGRLSRREPRLKVGAYPRRREGLA